MKSELAMLCAGNAEIASQTGNKPHYSIGDLLFQSLDKDPTINLEEKIIKGGFENTPLYKSLQEKIEEIHFPAPVKPGYKSPMPVFNAPAIPLMKLLLFRKKRILGTMKRSSTSGLKAGRDHVKKLTRSLR